jgi:hypothetical protein
VGNAVRVLSTSVSMRTSFCNAPLDCRQILRVASDHVPDHDESMGGHMFRRSILALLVAALPLMASAVPALAEVKSEIVQPSRTYEGKTYGEWSAKWWQYAVGVTDPNADCTVNQNGPVWFLAGAPSSDGRPVHLSCDVPARKAMMVPIINAEWSTNEGGCRKTYQSLLACAAAPMDLVTQRSFSIDGVPVDLGPNPQNQSRFRVQSPPPPFPICAIIGNIFGPAGTGKSVADGFYVLIKPLKPGSHRLLFSGTVTFANGSTFVIDTKYNVKVGQ